MTKAALLFPGQGAQTVGMGAALCGELPAAKGLFDEASEVLGYDLLALCSEGPAEKLNATEFSQPALFVASLAALEKFRVEYGEAACEVAAGLSLGEYTALVFAGSISFADGVRLVRRRGAAMQQASDATDSAMISVIGLSEDQLQEVCAAAREDDVLELANFLCPGNVVLSGTRAACERAAALATQADAMKVVHLAVAGAFHTPIMEPAREQLAAALRETPIAPPQVAVVSNVDARVHTDPEEIRQLLEQQLVRPVQWEKSVRWMIDECGVTQFYEIGPGRVLRGLLKRINRKAACENISA